MVEEKKVLGRPKGIPCSESTKEKLRELMKAKWAKQKESGRVVEKVID